MKVYLPDGSLRIVGGDAGRRMIRRGKASLKEVKQEVKKAVKAKKKKK